MNKSPLPRIETTHDCCATKSLSGFYASTADVDVHLKKVLAERYDYTAILTSRQLAKYEGVLLRHGFRQMANWTNRVHHSEKNSLHLFVRGFENKGENT